MNTPQRPSARARVPHSPECEKPRQPNATGNSLESSLLQIFTDHQHTSLRLRETAGQFQFLSLFLNFVFEGLKFRVSMMETEEAKKEAVRKAVRVADLLVDGVNGGVQESFVNEKRIEMEIRALTASIVRFMKQTDQWLTATRSINTAIKEIGDFENWMKTMEFDCRSITAAIHNIHQE